MAIGQRLKQARKANHLSMRALAEKAGISAMAISKYERDLDTPSSGVLLRLSQALGVSLDFLFRPQSISVELKAYRKHAILGIKAQEAIRMQIQDWLERYLEVESVFPGEDLAVSLPVRKIRSIAEAEDAALDLRDEWNLGLDPIENLTQILEDQGIKIGLVSGFDHFDACTFLADDVPVIVSKSELPGDRQRFNLAHELGHLTLDPAEGVDPESAANRFAGALLVPAESAIFELGELRTTLDIQELHILKHKYGLSMQAWIYRAKDLEIITASAAASLFKRFRVKGWHRREPGNAIPPEKPERMQRLVYRALAEDLISRSRARELLGGSLEWLDEGGARELAAAGPGD